MKRRRVSISALILMGALLAWPRVSWAEHFDISLVVKASGEEARASWDTEPPVGGVNPRPVAHARAGEPVQVEWLMRSEYPHGVMKQVVVHFFVVRESGVGQKAVPEKSVPRLVESSFVIDYRPDYAAKGSVQIKVDRPGVYLVRIASEETEREHGHEHFSAIDLEVQ